MLKDLSISICVPAFNEEITLRHAVEDLQKTLVAHIRGIEIIIVDDGSTDSTPQLAEELAKEFSNVKVTHHKKKLGVGVCYRSALAAATGDYITWFPADHENPAEQFIPSFPYFKKDSIVIFHHLGRDNRFLLRRFISRIYTKFINIYFNLDLKYYNDLTIMPTSLARSLTPVSCTSVIWAEILIRVIKHGYKLIELSAPLKGRQGSRSKTFTCLSIIKIMKDIFYILLKRDIRDAQSYKTQIITQ